MNKKPYDAFIGLYLALNGIAVGQTSRNIRHIPHPDYDHSDAIALMLWAGLIAYTAHRAYRVYSDKQNDNNQKQR